MGMANHKDCKHYDDCPYRNDIGCCPNWCAQFKHRDDVRVVRCKDCKHWEKETGSCTEHPTYYDHGMDWYIYDEDDFCSCGERKADGAV